MIKVERVVCKESFTYTNFNTFTQGEMYFARKSKKGRTLLKSNEGRWVVVEDRKMSLINYTMTRFKKVDFLLFKSLRELRRLSV